MAKSMIYVDKEKDKFFIAICKQGLHSFLMLGLQDEVGNHVLCRIGKVYNHDPYSESFFPNISFIFDLLFGKIDDVYIMDEGVSREKKGEKKAITYQAYDLTYLQYVDFIRRLESLQQKNNKFRVYKPLGEYTNEGKEKFELSNMLESERKPKLAVESEPEPDELNNQKAKFDAFKKDTDNLRLDNTCRHTAIHLFIETVNFSPTPAVSNNFIWSLPCKTKLDQGKPTSEIPFYILPVPYTAYSDLSPDKQIILAKLYERMQKIVVVEPNSSYTQDKFYRLKELYKTISGPQKDLSLADLLTYIKEWKEANKEVLSSLRKTYFWDRVLTRTSQTNKMIYDMVNNPPSSSPPKKMS